MQQNLKKKITELAKRVKNSQKHLSKIPEDMKDEILKEMAQKIRKNKDMLLRENEKDVKKAKQSKMPQSFIDRLVLTTKRIESMSQCLEEISNLKSPVGEIIKGWRRPNGLVIQKVRVPIGVVLIIYEARPTVTSDCVGLCFKTSNGVVLRGSSHTLNSNLAIVKILKQVLIEKGLNEDFFIYVPFKEREAIKILLSCKEYIDLVIPRGGESLIKAIEKMSKIPVIKHYKGVCHIYVDKNVNIQTALRIVFNAKVQRPSVCNAVETLLVHKEIAPNFLPQISQKFKHAHVVIKGCDKTRKILPDAEPATQKDWSTEYLDLIISIKIVDSLEQAIEHINTYGTHHSDGIITEDINTANQFLEEVDSACCYLNASTRFTDGYEFGLGAEMGISTDKLHARGPMGLEELTTYKYIILGSGQIRE